MSERIYFGVRENDRALVYYTVTGASDRKKHYLHHRTGHRSHSPTGFNWGYEGSGPAELARALVADLTGNPEPEPRIYQEFKRKAIATIPVTEHHWRVTEGTFRMVLDPIMLAAVRDTNCGECLHNDVEIVKLDERGKCPRCGTNYGPPEFSTRGEEKGGTEDRT